MATWEGPLEISYSSPAPSNYRWKKPSGLKRAVDIARAQSNFLLERAGFEVNYRSSCSVITKCGCTSESLGELLKYTDFCILLLEIQTFVCNEARIQTLYVPQVVQMAQGCGLHLETGVQTSSFIL